MEAINNIKMKNNFLYFSPSRHDWKIVDRDVKPQHNQQIFISQWKHVVGTHLNRLEYP